MKAILVIDVPDELDYLHLYLEGRILYTTEDDIGFKFLKELSMCVLKPMPRKINREVTSLLDYVSSANQYVCGRNDCIDEILGDAND